jgi:primase-polymerase (primpol)-like protein
MTEPLARNDGNGTGGAGPTTALPAALAPLMALPNWLIWRSEIKNDKPTKVPYKSAHPREPAKTNDPATWSDYAAAVAAAEATSANGTGFCMTDTNIAAFDVDKCRNPETGALHPKAKDLVDRARSYTEVTPSGTGIRIIGTSDREATHRKFAVADGVSVEVY